MRNPSGGSLFVLLRLLLPALLASVYLVASQVDTGSWIWRNPLPQGNALSDLAVAGSLRVAVGSDGAIVTSSDGITWTARVSGTTDSLYSVAWSGSVFVAVGGDKSDDHGIILSSPDGITWTWRYGGSILWNVSWIGSRFVAVGAGTIVVSTDGVTWTHARGDMVYLEQAERTELTAAAWSGSRFIAVGSEYAAPPTDWSSTAAIWTSSNGLDWEPQQSGEFVADLQDVTWGAGKFVAVGNDWSDDWMIQTPVILTSADGLTWTDRSPDLDGSLYSVTYAGNRFVALGDGAILTSSDGITWTSRLSESDEDLSIYPFSNPAWSGTRFAVLATYLPEDAQEGGDYCDAVLTSTDAATWTRHELGTQLGLTDLHWDGQRFVATGVSGMIATSSDGVTWSVRRTSVSDNDLVDVVWSGTQFVATDDSDGTVISPDGVTWTVQEADSTPEIRAFAWSGTTAVGVGEEGTVYTSSDAILWIPRSSGITETLYGVAWSGTRFIAVGAQGTIISSTDGVTWEIETNGTAFDLYGVAWSGEKFAAVGSSGKIFTSADGSTWTSRASGTVTALQVVTWAGTRFLAMGAPETRVCRTSSDGVTWTSLEHSGNVSEYILSASVWAGACFVAPGYEGVWGDIPFILVSSDGVHWLETPEQSLPYEMNGIAWSGNRLAIVGVNGTVITRSVPLSGITPMALEPNVSTNYCAVADGQLHVTYTNRQTVTLDNAFAGMPPAEYQASESSSFAGASWLPYATAPEFELSAGDGLKQVYLRARTGSVMSTTTSAYIMLDTVPPTVTVDQAADQADPTDQSPVNFTVVFSEGMIGFDESHLVLGGTANPTAVTVTETVPYDGSTYNVAVSGMQSNGTVTLSIPADTGGQDLAGNELPASTSTDDTVTYALPVNVELSVDTTDIWEGGAEDGGPPPLFSTITATLMDISEVPVTVSLAFGGTATPTNDYTVSASVITVPAGSLAGTITVTAVNDLFQEPDETVVVSITSVEHGVNTGETSFTLTIHDNDASPVANDDQLAVVPGGSVTGNVLANDTDEDFDTLTVTLITYPIHGEVTLAEDGTLTYTHSGDDSTEDAFTYRANDGQHDSNIATVTVTVALANIYVDDTAVGGNTGMSWGDALTELQAALALAGAGTEIHVAEGIYRPSVEAGGTGDRYRTFQMKNGMSILGGYPDGGGTSDPAAHPTVLSGDIGVPDDISDNCYHVFFHPAGFDNGRDLDSSAVLDGFIITAGNADGNDSDRNRGGGMYCQSASPTLNRCTFINNRASQGAGMSIEYGAPVLADCTFEENHSTHSGGGLYVTSSCSATFIRCRFSGNSTDGDGGGLYHYTNLYGSLSLAGCWFLANSAAGKGGGIYNGNRSSPILTNCIFAGNYVTGEGGAMYNTYYSSPVLNSCTFAGNTVSGTGTSGWALYNSLSSPKLTNCILWHNTGTNGAQIINSQSTPTVTYSCVEGGYTGTGNISADPLFVDAPGPDGMYGTDDDNLRLQSDSPCIDAGTNNADNLPATDLAGNTRRIDVPATPDTGDGNAPIIDMGAYERRAGQSIIFNSLSVVTYGDSPFEVVASATSGLPVSLSSSKPTVAVVEGTTITILAAGTTTITALQSGNGDWELAEEIRELTVNPAPLTCTAADLTKVYGVPNPDLTVICTGLRNGDLAPAVLPALSCSATLYSGVGVYPITLTGGSDPNYTLALQDGTLTVTRRELTARADDQNRLIGEANPQFSISYTGFANGDGPGDLEEEPAATCPATSDSPAGPYPITVSGGGDKNYSVCVVNGTLWVLQGGLLHLWIDDGLDRGAFTLSFGEDEGANDCYDVLDVLAPSAETGRASAYLFDSMETDPDKQKLSTDLRPCRVTSRWRLVLHVPDQVPVTLSWDVSGAMQGREVYLQELRGERPIGFPVNLRVGNAPLEATVDTEYEIVYGAPETWQLELHNGWNNIGTPLLMTENFGAQGEGRDLNGISLPAWIWENNAYVPIEADDAFSPETGHFVFCDVDSVTLDLVGVPPDGVIQLNPGWNLISPVATVSLPSIAGLTEPAWCWEPSTKTYSALTVGMWLQTGQAYWMFVISDNPITFTSK